MTTECSAVLVFFEPRLVFLSMPKTGTTAYQAALRTRADMVISGPPALKHASLRRYQRFVRPMFAKLFELDMEVVAVIREPVSWLGSWYRYRQRHALDGHENSTSGLSYSDFVEAYCSENPPAYARVGAQERFLEPARGHRDIDQLFAYEDQESLRSFLTDRLGRLPDIPTCNVSPIGDLTLDADSEAKLHAKHARAFALHASARR